MYDVITIGSSLVDIFISSSDLEASREGDRQVLSYGDKLSLTDFHLFTGGGASNTAVALARLGYKTAVISETGADEFAALITRDFNNEGVSTHLLIQEKLEHTGGSVLLVGAKGARIAMTHRGAASMLDAYDIPAFWLGKSSWVHLSSISGQLSALNKIFQTLLKDQDTKLSWNPGKKELALLNQGQFDLSQIPCEVFFVNDQEWTLIEKLQEQILANFPQVVVTMGAKGGDVYLYGKKSFHYEAQPSRLIDATGAGDAFAAAYVAALLSSKPVEEAIVWGVRNASNVLAFYGAKAGLLRRSQMLELLAVQAQ